ncbi:MAG TPA: GyrI-like domain-containing protein [Candidatus Binataceae bacterium]|nr:GyrI-like domain-containing protein [Candidatus Binataceae bacterium]
MKQVTERDYEERIERIVKLLEADPAAHHALDDLAGAAHFSRFHFHRIYRAMTGETVNDTARRLRLARAARQLASTNTAVTEIALDAGYESVQTFSRAFSSLTSLSPREFRSRRIRLSDLINGPAPRAKGGTSMKVEIVELMASRAFTYRHLGPMSTVKDTYSRLWQWQIENGIAGKTREAIGICYGDETGDDEFRYYAGVVWDKPVKAAGDIEVHEVPGGKYGCYRLVGSHDGIPAAFQRIYGEWLPASGFAPDDRPALEIYRNNPFDTAANELITDLMIPIR